ncbi:EamA family transporter RarD [Paracoccus suum]|uniref:EamA family transporter RarD n=1 Tax=Paracoccus suum TaxID=2259340 RepID=A0A344PJW3_9RHOB|nr:EamA family transporter RarD [Paracoccus suum]AXC49668.1 EamA family transporter RarD [Paracoccus suum]
MQAQRAGLLSMLGACFIWGSSAIYFKALVGVPPGELLAHRILWSLALFTGMFALQGRLGHLVAALRGPNLRRIALAAVMMGSNWLVFIIGVFSGHVMQTSLGYYIFPLFSVLIGVVLFGERLTPLQIVAVGLATLAVTILAVGLGVAPWLSLAIAATFAVYGTIKKGLDLPPAISVAAELAVLAPMAAVWLILRPEGGGLPLMGQGWQPALLVGSSLMTAVPMLMFTFAARRLDLATVGLLQYVNPTLQFLTATLWFREPFTRWHLIAFPLIWLALGLYSAAALHRRRALPGTRARL